MPLFTKPSAFLLFSPGTRAEDSTMSVEKVQHRHRWRRKVNGVTCYLPPWCNLSSSAGGWRPTPFAYPSSATFFFSRCSSLRSPSSAILRGLPPPFFLQASSTSVHRAGWRLKVGFLSLAARTYRLDDLASSFHRSLSHPLSLSLPVIPAAPLISVFPAFERREGSQSTSAGIDAR